MLLVTSTVSPPTGRAPHGARGLKFLQLRLDVDEEASRPARGAWIEISATRYSADQHLSRPARGAWIEIALKAELACATPVAPRTGRVD